MDASGVERLQMDWLGFHDKLPVRFSGMLINVPDVDARAIGMGDSEVTTTDPQQRLLLSFSLQLLGTTVETQGQSSCVAVGAIG